MKKLVLILALITINLTFSQSQSIQRELDFLKQIEDRKIAKEEEQENLDRMYELYDAVNTLQALRKYHYEKRYDKEYLKQYKKKLFYGLYPEKSWEKDKDKLDERLQQCIMLYNEHYQRCTLYYPWTKQFPMRITKYLKVDDLMNKYLPISRGLNPM